MISRTRPSFWRAFDELPEDARQAAELAYRQFEDDPGHSSLRFKKLQGMTNVWSVRVTRDIRAIGVRDGATIEWAWIGTHAEFDKLFG